MHSGTSPALATQINKRFKSFARLSKNPDSDPNLMVAHMQLAHLDINAKNLVDGLAHLQKALEHRKDAG